MVALSWRGTDKSLRFAHRDQPFIIGLPVWARVARGTAQWTCHALTRPATGGHADRRSQCLVHLRSRRSQSGPLDLRGNLSRAVRALHGHAVNPATPLRSEYSYFDSYQRLINKRYRHFFLGIHEGRCFCWRCSLCGHVSLVSHLAAHAPVMAATSATVHAIFNGLPSCNPSNILLIY